MSVLNDIPKPEELIGSRAIIQGASGAGKTYAIRKILEGTHGRMQHIVLDVEDELFTLREKFDYVLIGGEHADAPLGSPSALAKTLLELGVSAIIALNDLTLAKQRVFIGEFILSMMNAPRALWHPVLVVLDEAHRYAPTFGNAESSEALTLLATAGRKRGFGAIFATQRLSQLSKDILGQCPNRLMGRVDQALDRRIAADVLGFAPSGEDARELMRLKHQFWIVGPALADEPELVMFSPCITTHLQSGQRDVPPPPAPERVKSMLAALSKATAKDGAKPRVPATVDQDLLRKAEERGMARGKEAGEKTGRDKAMWELAGRIERAQALFSNAIAELASLSQLFEEPTRAVAPTPDNLVRPVKIQSTQPETGSGLSVSAEEFLRAGMSVYPVPLTWGQLGVLCGRKARGGSFNTARKQILNGSYGREDGNLLRLSGNIFALFKEAVPSEPRDDRELLKRMIAALPSPANEMLSEIAASGPILADALGAKLGRVPRGGSWNTGMAILKANDLIRETARGLMLASYRKAKKEIAA